MQMSTVVENTIVDVSVSQNTIFSKRSFFFFFNVRSNLVLGDGIRTSFVYLEILTFTVAIEVFSHKKITN